MCQEKDLLAPGALPSTPAVAVPPPVPPPLCLWNCAQRSIPLSPPQPQAWNTPCSRRQARAVSLRPSGGRAWNPVTSLGSETPTGLVQALSGCLALPVLSTLQTLSARGIFSPHRLCHFPAQHPQQMKTELLRTTYGARTWSPRGWSPLCSNHWDSPQGPCTYSPAAWTALPPLSLVSSFSSFDCNFSVLLSIDYLSNFTFTCVTYRLNLSFSHEVFLLPSVSPAPGPGT